MDKIRGRGPPFSIVFPGGLYLPAGRPFWECAGPGRLARLAGNYTSKTKRGIVGKYVRSAFPVAPTASPRRITGSACNPQSPAVPSTQPPPTPMLLAYRIQRPAFRSSARYMGARSREGHRNLVGS